MKYLIIGLGNPGLKYERTRHNIGFKVLDSLAILSSVSFKSDRYAYVAQASFQGRRLVLIKPNTFMNLSGKAVNYWMHYTKVPLENTLVVTDDISLPFGTLRMRQKGSHGGHNGLKDIQLSIGNNSYPRLRFGVGNDFLKGRQAEYVLNDFSIHESKDLEKYLQRAVKMVQGFSTIGIERTMSDFNGK